jgi:hypothetical protein
MGLLGGLIVYGFGKRRGRRQANSDFARQASAERSAGALAQLFTKEDCVHYHNFCRNFGSCDGMTCEKGE